MSYDEQTDFNTFDFHWRGTHAQHREIELRMQLTQEYQEWAVLQAALRNGRGYAMDAQYQALCRQLVERQVMCSRVVCKLIDEVLR